MKEIATMECTGGAGKFVKEGRCAMIGSVSIMTPITFENLNILPLISPGTSMKS